MKISTQHHRGMHKRTLLLVLYKDVFVFSLQASSESRRTARSESNCAGSYENISTSTKENEEPPRNANTSWLSTFIKGPKTPKETPDIPTTEPSSIRSQGTVRGARDSRDSRDSIEANVFGMSLDDTK